MLNDIDFHSISTRWKLQFKVDPPSINEHHQRLTKQSNEVTGRDFLSSQFVPAV